MGHFTWIESLLLLMLTAASLYLFWRRFGRVVAIIRASRSDPDFHLRHIPRRIRMFVEEVLLQAKVIRHRPLPGLAHAFVFWGFCAFALITINHFAAGLNLPFLSPEGAFSRVYFWLAALFAIAVAVSITGLAIRRFVVRPRWLGPLSPESGVIAGLILVLMLTYLATLWVDESTAPGRLNWWIHTLALLVFLPLIPHTKHLHLILSPATIFLRRDGFSAIPPLAGDEDFGLDTGKDVTRILSLQAFSCVECGRCSEHCPATNTGKVLNPKEVILGVRDYLKQHGPKAEEPIVGTHVLQEAIFQCTTCGACEFQCPVGIQHLPAIIGLRRGATNTGKWEDDYGTKLFLNLERNGNPLGLPASERDKFIAKHSLPLFDGSQQYLLWLGCMAVYDPHGRDTLLALVRLLRHLNITFGVLKKETCTGDAARRLGNDLLFQQLAEKNLEALQAVDASRLVSICPHCVRTIGVDWQEYGANLEIEHHSELLARHAAQLPGPLGPAAAAATGGGPGSDSVVYHDPCYLGRYREVYEEPRAVLRHAGATLTEPPVHASAVFAAARAAA
jgi:Fe-S oxidoreductase